MINSTYAKAYTEVLEIIKYFPKEEYAKISKEKIEFYQKNKDKEYNFIINPEIDLSEQKISPTANAIIVNLFRDYFATEEQKNKIKEILDLNQKKEDQEKYGSDNLFKIKDNEQKKEITRDVTNTALTEYKESFFVKFKNFIFRMLHIRK